MEKADAAGLGHVRRLSSDYCCPDSLHQIFAGCKKHYRASNWVGVNFLDSNGSHHFVMCYMVN